MITQILCSTASCRPRIGQEREPRKRIAARRSRARNPRGQEATPDPDRQRPILGQHQAADGRDQSRGLIRSFNRNGSAPDLRGAFVLGGSLRSIPACQKRSSCRFFRHLRQTPAHRRFSPNHRKRLTRLAIWQGGNGATALATPGAWSSSCLVRRRCRNKAKGQGNSGVDQSCVAGQNLAWSIRTAMLS